MEHKIIIKNLLETEKLAKLLIDNLSIPNVITLSGDLGAGKTTFVKGCLKALNYQGKVISPTFNILKCYFDVQPHIYHIDAYRLEDNNHDLGLEEYIESDGLCFIEWPQFIADIIPNKHLEIYIKIIDDEHREFIFIDRHNFYQDFFKELVNNGL